MDATKAIELGKAGQVIVDMEAAIASCTEMIASNGCFTGKISVSDPKQGRNWLEFPSMTVEESATLFVALSTIFTARSATAAQQLAAV